MNKLVFSVRLVLALFLLVFSFYDKLPFQNILLDITHTEFFTVFSVLLVSCLLLYIIIAYKIRKCSTVTICMVIFFLALLPRFILLAGQFYTPTSDFKNYFSYGQNIYNNRLDLIASTIAAYQMPKMSGLALFNGLIAHIFSPSLNGFITANILITSSICVMLFLLVKHINKNAGILSGILYALYPSSIISSQITTNHHGALLSMLIAIYVYQKSLTAIDSKKHWIYIVLSVIFIIISNFFHQSIIILLISILLFILINVISKTINKHKIGKIILSYIFIVFIFIYSTDSIVKLCYKNGIINSQKEISILFKFAMGTDIESNGMYNNKYGSVEYKNMSPTNQEKAYWEAIKNNFKKADTKQLLFMFADKTHAAWFMQDSYISTWYRNAQSNLYAQIINEELLTDELALYINKEGFAITETVHLDMFYVQTIYLFAIIGLLTAKNIPINSSINILLFLTIGWIIYIALTEMQTRYRYIAMPTFFMLSAVGMIEMTISIKRYSVKLRKR